MKIADIGKHYAATAMPKAAAKAQAATAGAPALDSVFLSDEWRQAAVRQAEQQVASEQALFEQALKESELKGQPEVDMQWIREQIDQANEQAKALAERCKVLLRCFKIASRIMNGNIVPKQDERYLAKHESEMYVRASLMRRLEENPKECDRVTKDEYALKANSLQTGAPLGDSPVPME